MKKIVVMFSITGIIMVGLFVSLFKGSYANSVLGNDISLEIYDNENIEILKDDMKYFIDLVDDSIIMNSSYKYSNKLNENYDFLTKFAISFILDNEELFDVIYGDKYVYVDEFGVEYTTDKFINIDEIYNVTNKILGVDYYYIVDENLFVDDNTIALVDIKSSDFEMVLDSVLDIVIGNGYYDVYVKYVDNDIKYIYRFEEELDNRLIISNLVIEG